jgi:hypothetical protein
MTYSVTIKGLGPFQGIAECVVWIDGVRHVQCDGFAVPSQWRCGVCMARVESTGGKCNRLLVMTATQSANDKDKLVADLAHKIAALEHELLVIRGPSRDIVR